MNKYRVEWFSGVNWGWELIECLAYSEEQVRSLIDNRCSPELRKRDGKDTLTVKFIEQVPIPYILHG